MRDATLSIVLNPGIIMRDPALLLSSIVPLDSVDSLGRNPSLVRFCGAQIQVKNSSGARVRAHIPVYAQLLLERIQSRHLNEAVAICRMTTSEPYLWAVLAGYCLEAGELELLHQCCGALGHVDKLEQIERIKQINNKQQQAAEMRLLAADRDAAKMVQKSQPVLEQIRMAVAMNEWAQALQVFFYFKKII